MNEQNDPSKNLSGTTNSGIIAPGDVSGSSLGMSSGESVKSDEGDVKQRLVRRLGDVAEGLKPNGESTRLDPLKKQVAGYIESAAGYLDSADFGHIDGYRENAVEVIRRNPLSALAVGFGVGVLFGRLFRR